MKVRLFFVLALVVVFAVTAFSGGATCDKSKSKNCSIEQTKAKSEQCTDSKMKASNKMDCCKKEMKEVKANNSSKETKKDVAKLVKDTK
ncbi:MAG: hypothetical protein HYZ34_14615 [Ignavibacteriae bacterium]|nr:hypothetical protein [Ignavibacteriota bacterium]